MSRRFHSTLTLLLLSAAALLAGCERPPIQVVQHGFRGTGMAEIYNPRTVAKLDEANQLPAAIAPATPGGPAAAQVYQNVKVLNDLTVGEFSRTMVAMTAWVAPEQGCTYCHNAQNFASDELYTKVVARKMLQMTRKINTDYKSHVAATGVTCYTCHRGNNIPANVWFKAPPEDRSDGLLGDRAGQNLATAASSGASLPEDPFTPFLLEAKEIRVNGKTALAQRQRAHHQADRVDLQPDVAHVHPRWASTAPTAITRGHSVSGAGGPPQRTTAWYGIRMVRDLNNEYMAPITERVPGPSTRTHRRRGQGQLRRPVTRAPTSRYTGPADAEGLPGAGRRQKAPLAGAGSRCRAGGRCGTRAGSGTRGCHGLLCSGIVRVDGRSRQGTGRTCCRA